MPLLKKNLRVITALCLSGFSGSLWAVNTPNYLNINQSTEFQRVTRMTQQAERGKIVEYTQNTFSLLGAEIALERGQPEVALNTYLSVLKKTKDPEVAERAMELAVSLHQYELAESIYALWQDIQPESSPAQRRITWARALALGDSQQIFDQLGMILQEADERQIRRIFILLSQVSLQNPNMVRMGGETVHQVTQQYADMPEAVITEIIYSSGNRQTKRTLEALKTLSQIDQDLSYVSRLALGVLVREQPEILLKFFDKNDSKKLSSTWQELEIENLIYAKRYHEAQRRLQELLEDQASNANLYFLAASQAYQQDQNSANALIYLEKAYQYGEPQQKSRAATMLAMNLLNQNKLNEAETWIERIQATEFAFNKNALEMVLASQRKNWNQVIQLYTQNRSLEPNAQYHIFSGAERESMYFNALMEVRSPNEVLKELNQMLKTVEKSGNKQRLGALLHQRGTLYSDKLNRMNDAIADFRRYLALNPDSATAQNSLGYTLLSLPGYLNEGADLISKAYQKAPENAAINDSMGWAYFLKGDYQTAKMYLEYAYKHQQIPEIAAHLGETYWLMGERDKAMAVWKEAWLKDKTDKILNATLLKYQIRF